MKTKFLFRSTKASLAAAALLCAPHLHLQAQQTVGQTSRVSSPSVSTRSRAAARPEKRALQVGRWGSIGPTRITRGMGAVGRLSAIAIDPISPQTIYVGARASGVWKTINTGSTWLPVADSLPTLAIANIAIDPSHHLRVYVATLDAGMFRSEDGGESWIQTSSAPLNPMLGDGSKLVVHPTDENVLYLTSKDGLHRSSDKGLTWKLVLSGAKATGFLISSIDPSKLYAALSHDTDHSLTGVYETASCGNSSCNWKKLTGCSNGRLPAVTEKTSIKITSRANCTRATKHPQAGRFITRVRLAAQ